jgi:hypothetical protein
MSALTSDPVVVAGLGLLGVPPLPEVDLLDEHIEVAERAAAYHSELASSDPGRFLGDDEGPAAEALQAMARQIGSMIRTVMKRVGDVLRRLTGGRLTAKIERVAGRAHDHWRSHRLRADGSYEPRIRRTIDERWIKRHGVDEVDIANTHYRDLPADMRRDNWESADVAVRLIRDSARRGVNVRSDDFLETASSSLHDAWLYRNGFRAAAEQRLPYAELSEVEKAKDRVFILNALDVL